MAKAYMPTPEELDLIRDCLAIEERSPSGLVWLVNHPSVGIEPGDAAFTAKVGKSGYYGGILSGIRLKAHRVVFFLSRGYWPAGQVDHIDGDNRNNAPDNLREATQAINQANRKSKGYHITKDGKYKAQTLKDGKLYSKTFDNATDARQWYEDKKRELFPGIRWWWSDSE